VRASRAAAALGPLLLSGACIAGPVEATLQGPRFCPRDRDVASAPLTPAEAIARARTLLPDGYCGVSRSIDGCDADAEFVGDSFRVYVHQFKMRAGRRDWTGLAHTYVILDPAGNCLAHIPGTGLFERIH
jgi:hypothetical protein